MRCVVTFVFGSEQVVEILVNVMASSLATLNGREWFEEAWSRLGCEPLRPSGKILLLDRILCVTEALGYPLLSENYEEALELARQTALVLNKPVITVDLVEQTVSF